MTRLVAHDRRWAAWFTEEATRVAAALGPRVRRIDHVGSTAVPGLEAKPVIDLQASLDALEPRDPVEAALAAIGWRHVPLGDFDRVYPWYVRLSDDPAAAAADRAPARWHLHLCVAGSAQERDHLAFRDRLRADPGVAAAYRLLKRRLARQHDGRTLASQEGYSLAKSAFVRDVLARPGPAAVPGRAP